MTYVVVKLQYASALPVKFSCGAFETNHRCNLGLALASTTSFA
jgi:hypothetical protein